MVLIMRTETPYIIYGLIDPFTGVLRYIGRSSSRLSRPRSHWENPKVLARPDHCHCWIRSTISRGKIPAIEVLEEFLQTADVHDLVNIAERFWIASVRVCGGQLTNITDGGDSFPNTRGRNNWMFGRTHPSKGKKLNLTPEQRARRASLKGKHSTPMGPDGKEIWRQKVTGQRRSVETRQKQSESALKVWAARKARKTFI